jgi:hypothetical protein
MTLSDWTDDELAANRRGEIAPSQLARLRSRGHRMAYSLVAVMIVLLALFTWLMVVRGETTGVRVIGLVFDGMVLVFGITALVMRGPPVASDLAGTACVAVTGPVAVTTRISARNKGSEQVILIGGEEVHTMFSGLEKLDGKTVTAYRLPHSKLVFALDRT